MNPNQNSLEYLLELVHKRSQPVTRICVLTGAGISAESGIKTFRAADGLWENHSIEEVATPLGFANNPALVQKFYNERRQQLLSGIAPNTGHISLARFQQQFSGEFTLITQNIDNLHELAGSEQVLHMHGELLKIRCSQTGYLYDCEHDVNIEDQCQCCSAAGSLRPHVVWFGEMPLYMEEIYAALDECDMFIAVGTSGNVYPAAGFFQVAQQVGAISVELNLQPSGNAAEFDLGIYGPATQVLPEFFRFLRDSIK